MYNILLKKCKGTKKIVDYASKDLLFSNKFQFSRRLSCVKIKTSTPLKKYL